MGVASTGAHENGNRSGADRGVTSHTWDLPPEDKIMWEGLTLHNGGQTLYGNVWPKVGLLHQTAIGHHFELCVNAGNLKIGSLMHQRKQAVSNWPGLAGGMRRPDFFSSAGAPKECGRLEVDL